MQSPLGEQLLHVPLREGKKRRYQPTASRMDPGVWDDCVSPGSGIMGLFPGRRDVYRFRIMSVVIEAQGISKRFFLGERNQRAFFEDVVAKVAGGARRVWRPADAASQPTSRRHFWALRDVSFQVVQGQTLAVIGENGAGKSTMLKILSRITQPTNGWAKVYGRLATLLEVGTGFHPEFSGRDNIYLNGTMLGLSRKEIRNRFEKIVEFSALEEFIDVPVKYYSSGMYVRLAFSVAAHLNPEIMILDEVLAVGDAAFQKKCFDRMSEIIGEGHAAILVSHGMGNIRKMSQICMWLSHGEVKMYGPTEQVVAAYEKQTARLTQAPVAEPIGRLVQWSAESKLADGEHAIVCSGERITLRFEIELLMEVTDGKISTWVADLQGLVLFSREIPLWERKPGILSILLELPSLPIRPGEYIATCTLSDGIHAPCPLLPAAHLPEALKR
jgi:lipopolysaccharide transport system ATP-binding protein